MFVLPSEAGLVHASTIKRNIKTLAKMSTFAQLYFDPRELPAMLEELLPHFTTSYVESAFVVAGLMNLLFPTTPAPPEATDVRPQTYLPTYFHLWQLVNRSKTFDNVFIDHLSRFARDCLPAEHIPFSEFGIFTSAQSSMIFTSILRLLEIPVGQANSPYSARVDLSSGLSIMLDRDPRKHPVSHNIARWLVMSLSPACLEHEDSVLHRLEGLIQAVETFFHPSNSGAWTRTLAQLVYYLADFFVMRWNRERNGEMEVPPERRLNDALKKRFVLCLRDVIFMGIYSKSGTAMNFSLATLQSLAYLEPKLVLPGALQRIYPSMQGLVEVHRTASSLRSLQTLSRILVRTRGFRCHITTLLGLALPGIDANDLEKSLQTLSFIQAVCYNIPFADLTQGREDVNGNMLAMQWITGELERMENEGANVEIDYDTELTDEDEEMILRSSTTGFAEFLTSFLGRVFTLLENLPDAARVRSGSPEEHVISALPATFMPLLACLSDELYDLALNKILHFVSNHVVHPARDAMAFICNGLCKINPEKALKVLVPNLIRAIRNEIEENGAASTRTTGVDVLPRDKGLVWNVSILSMCVVHVGDAVLKYKDDLFDIAIYMQKQCRGIPTVHISNFIHHLLLNLTGTFTNDNKLYEPSVAAGPIGPEHWGVATKSQDLTVKWHVPNREEIEFAVKLFQSQAENALVSLRSLLDGSSSIKRDGSGKDWSDEVSRNLVLLRLVLAGVSVLFDQNEVIQEASHDSDNDVSMGGTNGDGARDDELDASEDNVERPTFSFPAGYCLQKDDDLYKTIHDLRKRTGETLHAVHEFLTEKQEDDVSTFQSLYAAYRSWFVDVGIERSAHVLDRITKLLVTDVQPYKLSGVRKDYPRPLLVRRANVYHLQRLRYNAMPRPRSNLDEQMLLDLVHSATSLYTDIRRTAQGAAESALKVLKGARLFVIPSLLQAFQKAVKDNDFPRIKGALYSLLYGSLTKTVGRNWDYTPDVIKTYIQASAADKPSIQKICSGAVFAVMDWSRTGDRLAIVDEDIVASIAPAEKDAFLTQISHKKDVLEKRRLKIDRVKAQLSVELVDMCKASHWKKESRTATIAISLGIKFDHIASDEVIDLIIQGSIGTHPGLRGMYSQALVGLFTMCDIRSVCEHSYENYVLGKQRFPTRLELATKRDEPGWTEEFLAEFTQPNTKYYIDHDFPGWLVWGGKMPAYKADIKKDLEYDETEWEVRKKMGKLFTREWFVECFKYHKQEPRDATSDQFRVGSSMMLLFVFELLLRDELTAVTWEEIKEEVTNVLGDGTDKHQHRATAEIIAALICAVSDSDKKKRDMVWDFTFPIVRDIFADGLTPENHAYWDTFLHMIIQGRDPRRVWPLIEWLTSFRLDMSSNAAFKESSKIQLLQQCIAEAGWHFQLEKPILEDFLAHLDHPYKGVREVMGFTLSIIYRTRYHESYKNVDALIEAQKKASSVGIHPYQPSQELTKTLQETFVRLEEWRKEREPGQQTPSSYTSGSKTVLLWLDSTLQNYDCTMLLQFFPSTFIQQLLHMMDVKEDPELQSLAYHVFRHLPNIPHPAGGDSELVDALIRIGRTAPSWHQRLRVMINMQIIYFRRLFLLSPQNREKLFDCVSSMLEDPQSEVRAGASTTLSGMIRCSPLALRDAIIPKLQTKFTKMLIANPLPKKPRGLASGLSSARSTGTSTPTPEHTKMIHTRHAAVLGLGALIQAFPYMSPPPAWMPGALTTLSTKAASDPGVVGQSVKSIISDFKKTRQDTWHIDVKVRIYDWFSFRIKLTSNRHLRRTRWRIFLVYCGRATLRDTTLSGLLERRRVTA